MNAPVNPKELELQTVEFKLDGQTIVSYEGETILKAAKRHGIVSHLCFRMAIVLMVIVIHLRSRHGTHLGIVLDGRVAECTMVTAIRPAGHSRRRRRAAARRRFTTSCNGALGALLGPGGELEGQRSVSRFELQRNFLTGQPRQTDTQHSYRKPVAESLLHRGLTMRSHHGMKCPGWFAGGNGRRGGGSTRSPGGCRCYLIENTYRGKRINKLLCRWQSAS